MIENAHASAKTSSAIVTLLLTCWQQSVMMFLSLHGLATPQKACNHGVQKNLDTTGSDAGALLTMLTCTDKHTTH